MPTQTITVVATVPRIPKVNHCFMGNVDNGDGTAGHIAWCAHCGGTDRPVLPMPVTGRGSFVSWVCRFLQGHKACPKPVNLYPPPAAVVEYETRARMREEARG